jgi:hypothetical protein
MLQSTFEQPSIHSSSLTWDITHFPRRKKDSIKSIPSGRKLITKSSLDFLHVHPVGVYKYFLLYNTNTKIYFAKPILPSNSLTRCRNCASRSLNAPIIIISYIIVEILLLLLLFTSTSLGRTTRRCHRITVIHLGIIIAILRKVCLAR